MEDKSVYVLYELVKPLLEGAARLFVDIVMEASTLNFRFASDSQDTNIRL